MPPAQPPLAVALLPICPPPASSAPRGGVPIAPRAPGAEVWGPLRTGAAPPGGPSVPEATGGRQGLWGSASSRPVLGGLPGMFWASGRKRLPPRMGRLGHHGHHDQKAVRPRVKPVSLNPNWPRVFWGQSLGSGPGPRVTRLSSRTSPGRPGHVPEGLNPGSGGPSPGRPCFRSDIVRLPASCASTCVTCRPQRSESPQPGGRGRPRSRDPRAGTWVPGSASRASAGPALPPRGTP